MSIALFFGGGITLEVERAHRTAFLNLCLAKGYPYSGFVCTRDGGLRVRFPCAMGKRLLDACRIRGIEPVRVEYTGLPFLFMRLIRRPGLFWGAIVSAFLLAVSGCFVWEIRTEGNEQLGSGEICEILRENGFYVGSYLPSLDVPSLENRILISTDRLSWISINLDGTVANVQVIEGVPKTGEEGMLPANLIAARDGQIEYLELFRGESVVKVGQAVKAGELLVSGLLEGERSGCRFTRASGRVMARTERVLCINVPLSYTQRVYGEEKTLERCVNFFDFSMKIFKSTGNEGMPCDIIEKDSAPVMIGAHTLPLSVSTRVARYYHETECTRSEEEAVSLAFLELSNQLDALSGEVEILSKSIVQRIDGNGVFLECRISCIENIATLQEFEIAE